MHAENVREHVSKCALGFKRTCMLGCETRGENVRDGEHGEVYSCTKGCVTRLWEGLRAVR